MSKNSSAKYCQNDKEWLQKNNRERYQSISKEEKSDKMVEKDTKLCQKMSSKSWLSIEKNITKWEQSPYYNYKNLFPFEKFVFFCKFELVKWARWDALTSIRNFLFKINLFEKFSR